MCMWHGEEKAGEGEIEELTCVCVCECRRGD